MASEKGPTVVYPLGQSPSAWKMLESFTGICKFRACGEKMIFGLVPGILLWDVGRKFGSPRTLLSHTVRTWNGC